METDTANSSDTLCDVTLSVVQCVNSASEVKRIVLHLHADHLVYYQFLSLVNIVEK